MKMKMFDTFTPCKSEQFPPLSKILKTQKIKSDSDWNEKQGNQNDTHLQNWKSESQSLNMGAHEKTVFMQTLKIFW